VQAKLGLGPKVLQWFPVLRRALREADVVHFRCPCNIALVGLLAAHGLPVQKFAMYAGNWAGYPGESPFYRLQRAWLNSRSYQGLVAVYGRWNRQPGHVLTSFSPSFTQSEWEEEEGHVARKLRAYATQQRLVALRIVCVGHLNADKNQASVLQAIKLLRDRGIAAQVELLGDGPEREPLATLAGRLQLRDSIRLRGRVSLQEVREANRTAHVAVLASRSEGYPKVLAEAMCGGAVPVASDVGINAEILAKGRGRLFPFADSERLAQCLAELAGDPGSLRRMVLAGRVYTRARTLEAFWALQHQILTQRLGVPAAERIDRRVPREALR
jgi:glycosyltransferase involved in cell wall biosynthesis